MDKLKCYFEKKSMAKTYVELTQQILQLQAQAETRRLSEAKGVIRTINAAIATYGLTAADLKFAQTAPTPAATPSKAAALASKSAAPAVVKFGGQGYADAAGNAWTGRGPRPKWLREALASGDSIAKYEVTGSPKLTPKAATAAVAVKGKALAKGKAPLPVKFRNDATGESWSGRGMKPLWLRQAISAGKRLEEFDVLKGSAKPSAVSAAPALAPAKQAVPARKLAPAAVPAKKVPSVKVPSSKAVLASPAAQKPSAAPAAGTTTKRATTKTANALQPTAAEAHVPVAVVNDVVALSAMSASAELVQIPPQ